MERKIRKLKRFAEGTLDPEAAKEYRRKLRQAQHELKVFVEEHRDVLKRDYSREKYYGKDLTNKAKKVDIFDDNEVPLNAELTSEEIIEELKTTKIGNQTLKDIENLPQRIKLTYENRVDGVRGDERNGEIRIFLRNCKNVKWAARSIIHEITHWKYGISQSQWSESVCIAHELMHKYNRKFLTIEEKRRIIKAVKRVYDDKNWRKGGIINGRRKSH